jgi:parallel beta-helix repeat protein
VNLWCSPHITWHNGFPSGGNYWSDYVGKYPNATERGNLGIWDTPYVIEGAKQSDPYPLVYPVVADRIIVPNDYPTIQEAINHADEGDMVLVRAGTYSESVSVNRTVSLIGENKDSTILNGTGTDPMISVEANNVKISGFSFEGWSFRNIVINLTTGVLIIENRIIFNALGIDVENSANITIENNVIEGNGLDNIGIMLAHSTECRIADNTITNAIYDGVRLWFSNSNVLNRNLIKDDDCGIFLHGSNENTISENTISRSGGAGIYFGFGSSRNLMFHNNFIDNWIPVGSYDGSVNIWDSGCEGNYWSDYTGTDSDKDGVGDMPYVIGSNNIDHYPLMSPYWIPADINHDLKVDILDVVKTTYAYGADSSDPRWNPHADIAKPYGKIDVFDVVLCTSHYGECA